MPSERWIKQFGHGRNGAVSWAVRDKIGPVVGSREIQQDSERDRKIEGVRSQSRGFYFCNMVRQFHMCMLFSLELWNS